MTNAVASWYPDPTGRFQFRFWDGRQWTEHVASGGTQSSDPLSLRSSSPRASEHVSTDLEPRGAGDSAQVAEGERRPGVFTRMRDERRARAAGRDAFEAIAMRAAGGDPAVVAALPDAVANARALYRPGQLESRLWDAMAAAVSSVIADDILTAEEEQHLHRLGEILGTPMQAMEAKNERLFEELVIAGINDGRFPSVSNPGIMLKRDEEAYGSFTASLMRERAVREFRGGSSGVSIPLGGGVRYRVGGVRGRSVLVGTELVVQDSGILYVTNQRVLFIGQTKTLEFRHDRLVGLEQFTDGLRLNVSNRQTASLFKMSAPSIAASLVSAAAARNR